MAVDDAILADAYPDSATAWAGTSGALLGAVDGWTGRAVLATMWARHPGGTSGSQADGLAADLRVPPGTPVRRPGPDGYAFRFPVVRIVGGRAAMTIGRGVASLAHADAEDAPVVAALRTWGGSRVAFRWCDGTHLRPLSAPGIWEPVGVDAFVEAVEAGPVWADNPYAAQSREVPLLSLDETFGAPWKSSADEDARLEAAAAGWASGPGRLVVVDGVVHAPCPAPVATLARDVTTDGVGITWVVDWQVSGIDDMAPIRARLTYLAFPAVPRHGMAGAAWAGSAGNHVGRATSLPLVEASGLRALLSAHVDRLAAPVDWDDPPFEVLRPDLLRPRPGRALDAMAEVVLSTPSTEPDDAAWRSCREAARRLDEGRPRSRWTWTGSSGSGVG